MRTLNISSGKIAENVQSAEAPKPNEQSEASAGTRRRELPVAAKDQFEQHHPSPLASLTTTGRPDTLPASQAPTLTVGDLLIGKGEIQASIRTPSPEGGMAPKPGPRPGPDPISLGIAFPGIAPKADQDVPPGSPPPDPDPIPEPDRRFAGLYDGIGPQPGPLPGPDPVSQGMAFTGIGLRAEQDVPPSPPQPEPEPEPPNPDLGFDLNRRSILNKH